MNPVYQITAQLDTLSSMASKWPPFGTKLGILPLAPKCTQHTKFQTIWTIGIDFGIWGIFVLVGKLLMHIPLDQFLLRTPFFSFCVISDNIQIFRYSYSPLTGRNCVEWLECWVDLCRGLRGIEKLMSCLQPPAPADNTGTKERETGNRIFILCIEILKRRNTRLGAGRRK